ncbi:MAG: preprotein translocase subunit YajC [Magnetococcales bacterium]|nr:preprotein translocase subunit YajC [Magnetococcales bacterium]
MFDVIGPAWAQNGAPAAGGTGATVLNILFMVLMFLVFYFLLIRPQQKEQKRHRQMIANLQRGDSVVTGGGIIGRIHRVEEDTVQVEIGEVDVGGKAVKPVRIRVRRESISTVTAKSGVPATPDGKEKGDKPKEGEKTVGGETGKGE